MEILNYRIYTKEADWESAFDMAMDILGFGKPGCITVYCEKIKHPSEDKWAFPIYDSLDIEEIERLPVGDNINELPEDWYNNEDMI